MLASSLELSREFDRSLLRVCAVSYLNTAPLVYGFRKQVQPEVALEMALPAVCADRIRNGVVDVGLVPVAEIARQRLAILGNTGIACEGTVRSILLFSKKHWSEVRTVAGDSSSRTSVLLAQILLRERYGAQVVMEPHAPDLEAMLANHDAALIIGDPALRIESGKLPYACLDLGAEWQQHTGLPMVFAAWAGFPKKVETLSPRPFAESLTLGMRNLEAIVEEEATPRHISPALAREYLQRHIRFWLGEREFAGMREFLRRARQHGLLGDGELAHPVETGTHPGTGRPPMAG